MTDIVAEITVALERQEPPSPARVFHLLSEARKTITDLRAALEKKKVR